MSESSLSQVYGERAGPPADPVVDDTPTEPSQEALAEVEDILPDGEPELETADDAPQETAEDARIRSIAEAQGWRPNGKLGPLDFLEAIPRYSEGLVNKLTAAEERIQRLHKVVGAQINRDNERAQQEAEQRLRDATERGDVPAAMAAAKDIHAQRETLDDPASVVPQDAAQVKVKTWVERPEQAWFNTNPEMAQDTVALYNAEVSKRGVDDPDVILPVIEKRIRQLYPEKFAAPTNPNRAVAGVRAPTNAARPTSPTPRRQATAEGAVDPTILAQYRRMGLSDADILKSLESYNGR